MKSGTAKTKPNGAFSFHRRCITPTGSIDLLEKPQRLSALGVRREKAALSCGCNPSTQPLQQTVNPAMHQLTMAK